MPSAEARPPTIVPPRMAAKVAASIQALARGQFLALEMIGQDAVFDRAEQRRDDAEQNSANISTGIEESAMPATARAAARDLGELQRSRHRCLVEAVGELAAKRRQQQEGGHEDGPRQA